MEEAAEAKDAVDEEESEEPVGGGDVEDNGDAEEKPDKGVSGVVVALSVASPPGLGA